MRRRSERSWRDRGRAIGGATRGVVQDEPGDRDVRDALPTFFRQASTDQRTNRRRHVGGQRRPVRLAFEDGGDRVRHGLARERGAAGQHFVEHAAERPDVRRACRPAVPAPARGSCRRPSRGSTPAARRRRAVARGESSSVAAPLTGSRAFASPKSSTFTVPSSRTLMFAGFRSRWTIPCSCAASSASAICVAIGSASSMGMAASRDPLGERRAFDQFHHEGVQAVGVLEAVDLRDVRVIE